MGNSSLRQLHRRRHAAIAAATLAGLAAVHAPLRAGTVTWTGASGTTFNNANNWVDDTSANRLPAKSGDSLVFDTGGTTLTDDLLLAFSTTSTNNTTLSGLTFTGASNFTINPKTAGSNYKDPAGNSFILGGPLTSSGTQVITENIGVTTTARPVNVVSGTLTLGGGTSTGTINVNADGTSTGTLVLAGPNSRDNSGLSVNVVAGTLVLAKSGTLAGGAHALTQLTGVGANATVQIGSAGSGSFQFYGHRLVNNMAGGIDLNGTNQYILGFSGTSNGQVYNSVAGTSSTMTMGYESNGAAATSTFAGVIKDNLGTGGTMSVYVQGPATGSPLQANTTTLSGQNTYSGTTRIAYGGASAAARGFGNTTLVLGNASASSNVLPNGNAVVMGGAQDANTGINTLQLGNTSSATAYTQTLSSLSTTGAATNRVVGGNANAASVLVLNATGTDTFGGILGGGTGATATQNNVALVVGSGNLSLTGVNTYTGPTTVDGGASLSATADAGLAATGTIDVQSGASLTLGSGAATSAGYTNAAGTLVLDSPTNSLVNLNFTGTTVLAALSINGQPVGPGTYSASALNTNGVSDFSGPGLVSVAPEPASLALLSAGSILSLRRRRRP